MRFWRRLLQLQLDVLEIALSAIHHVQVHLAELGQLAEVLRLEFGETGFERADLRAIALGLRGIELRGRRGALAQDVAAGVQERVREPRAPCRAPFSDRCSGTRP